MEILYVSNTTSPSYFKKLYDISRIKPGQQVQKFNDMLLSGFAKSKENNICAISVAPASFSTCQKKFFKSFDENENGILYRYAGFINLPIIKQMCVHYRVKKLIRSWALKTEGKSRTIICYALSPTLSSAALSTAKKFGIKIAAVVTDIPQLMNVDKQSSGIKSKLYDIYSKATYDKMISYDMYVILTRAMSGIINPENNPYIVIEGMADSKMAEEDFSVTDKYKPRVILYAGALFEKYGVKNLTEGFMSADIDNAELWVFGSGEMNEYFEKLDCEKVKYFGVVPNDEVLRHELKASLLVNPRPSDEEFTKYSFPSKNLEYMSTGTPILTCKLPGMPDEYLDYVYIAEDETAEGFSRKLTEIMSYDEAKLNAFGKRAKEFVLENKTNISQANKIQAFIKDNL